MDNTDYESPYSVAMPPTKPLLERLRSSLKKTFLPDGSFWQIKNLTSLCRKLVLCLLYLVPILEWAPRYTFEFFKADLIAGFTIASLAVPQGISNPNLDNLHPTIGLYSSFVPPLVYAILGSSRDLAVGTLAVGSLLVSSMLGKAVNPTENPKLYVQLALTATFIAGVFQAALGFFRLGFVVNFLSHATIVGFMSGAATVVCLQQLKGVLGLVHFTHETDLISVMHSIFSQTHQWRWESGVLGCCFIFFLMLTKYLSKKKKAFFWINAMAPLVSVIFGSLLVFLTHVDRHGVQVIGHLKKGLNPLSVSELSFGSAYLSTVIKTGIITGVFGLAEGVSAGRSSATSKNYHIDGNKEMIAFGMMNIAGSCTSCYLTTGLLSRSEVNFKAGCKTAVSNIVMATAVMITLLFLMPLFHYTPLVVLSSNTIVGMLGLIDFEAAIHLWKIDKLDFFVCIGAYLGVVFANVEVGLAIAGTISLLRVLLFIARPRIIVLGITNGTGIYRNIDQYPDAKNVPGVLILQIDSSSIYFFNANYLGGRISRLIDEEEDKLKSCGETSLRSVILDMSSVGSIDTSGFFMLEEMKKNVDRKDLKLVLANPRREVIEKLEKSKFIKEVDDQEWMYPTVGNAVAAAPNFMKHAGKPNIAPEAELSRQEDNV